MTSNLHPAERAFRIVLGLFLISLSFWGPKSPWFLLGFIPFVTGLVGWCPPYAMLGINTNVRRSGIARKSH